MWAIKHESHWHIVRRIERIDVIEDAVSRKVTGEESTDSEDVSNEAFDKLQW